MADAETLIAAMRKKSGQLRGLGYRVRFELSDTGESLLLDGTGGQAEIAEGGGEADTVLTLSSDNLARLIAGRLSPTLAFSTGKLKVDGSRGGGDEARRPARRGLTPAFTPPSCGPNRSRSSPATDRRFHGLPAPPTSRACPANDRPRVLASAGRAGHAHPSVRRGRGCWAVAGVADVAHRDACAAGADVGVSRIDRTSPALALDAESGAPWQCNRVSG